MEKNGYTMYQRLLAMLLCLVMLAPSFLTSARAAEAAATGNENGIVITDTITVPGYPSNSSHTITKVLTYDCGNGLTKAGDKSYMVMVTGTSAAAFAQYQATIKNSGYIVQNEKTVASKVTDANAFGSYLAPDGSYKLYTYYLPAYKETRIIVDTQKDTVEGYKYEAQTGKTVELKLVMWGLSMSSFGYDTRQTEQGRRNCGAMFVMLMPDNSLFIHDGGDIQQWSDEACDEFLSFCRKLTGTTNEKMVINTWFLSHAHHDHFRGFYRFINIHHDQFDLKNVVYNIDNERSGELWDISGAMSAVKSYYPSVRYYKPHTGESFNVAGVNFDVLYAQEDR
jgi:hypothetical protein